MQLVPTADKDAYRRIFEELRDSAEFARDFAAGGISIHMKEMNYSPEFGSLGHRPVDLWTDLARV